MLGKGHHYPFSLMQMGRFIFGLWLGSTLCLSAAPAKLSFNRDIRSILSENCFKCHGPDGKKRKGKLRLDVPDGPEGALVERKDGAFAIVPGDVEGGALVGKIYAKDPEERMPPPDSKLTLTEKQKDTLRRWVSEGAKFQPHWSYAKPVRHPLPKVKDVQWPRNAVDRFILAELERRNWKTSPEADRHALIRRVSLDLTGLPPTLAEVDLFVKDNTPDAYSKLVDRLLAKPTYGEHWARQWLDLARYADSAGYADDPARTIWAYRDWVIRAFNRNLPFDQFTIEQMAGDLLPNPTENQLTATAFHRNTQTNSEGGTDDEEFRNVAIVDRVNTTMAVWMGTTMTCSQCHNHKYDAISQKEFYRMFAVFNNTADADRRDESPLLKIFTDGQKKQKLDLTQKIDGLQGELDKLKVTALDGHEDWLAAFEKPVTQSALETEAIAGKGLAARPLPGKVTGLQVEGVDVGRLTLKLRPKGAKHLGGRYVRVTNVGASVFLHLAEVQVFSNGKNVAPNGKASQSTTDFAGPAKYGNDGNTDGNYEKKSVTHTAQENNPWWEVDLGKEMPIEKLALWNRLGAGLADRLKVHRVEVLDANRKVVWKQESKKVFKVSVDYGLDGARLLPFVSVPHPKANGLVRLAQPLELKAGDVLELAIKDFKETKAKAALVTGPLAPLVAALPKDIFSILRVPSATRTAAHQKRLKDYYAANNPRTQAKAKELAAAKKQLAGLKPATSVPIFREVEKGKRRKTHIQVRGNFQIKSTQVTEGFPEVFEVPVPEGPITRLTLAHWLVDERNPLTARVLANRYWEALFGAGIVRTSEEFGSQGELPTHPRLLDWLATEMVRLKWDTKAFLKLLVTSAAYQQSSRVTPKTWERDPANRYLAHGPRLRLSAEMIRDQALAVSGLLSSKMYGPPVKPPQPSLGIKAAFGSGIDWKTSAGEDKYRRGLYTNWRRSNPYPSMAAFDAPTRSVCTLKRVPTNTPLQALVTMNDPVYVEAAQALARRMVKEGGGTPHERVSFGLNLCLSRSPKRVEVSRLVSLYTELLADYQKDAAAAKLMATDPLGPLPKEMDAAQLAAWTVVGNVLLNLDETMMKR